MNIGKIRAQTLHIRALPHRETHEGGNGGNKLVAASLDDRKSANRGSRDWSVHHVVTPLGKTRSIQEQEMYCDK